MALLAKSDPAWSYNFLLDKLQEMERQQEMQESGFVDAKEKSSIPDATSKDTKADRGKS